MSDESEDFSGNKTIIYYISNLLGHQAELDSKHKFIEMLNMRRNVINSTIHRHELSSLHPTGTVLMSEKLFLKLKNFHG